MERRILGARRRPGPRPPSPAPSPARGSRCPKGRSTSITRAPAGPCVGAIGLDAKGHYSLKTQPGPNRVVVVILGRKQPEMHAFEVKEGENSHDIPLSP